MFQVICPECKTIREVKAKKPWMEGEPPYVKMCKSCCQLGKEKTEEHREKLRQAAKKQQTPEVLAAKREYMLLHPEHWKGKLKEGGAEEHCLGKTHSQETKRKISEGVKRAKGKKNES